MQYTIHVPVVFSMVVEANSAEEAQDYAAEQLHNAEITMDIDYDMCESWDDMETYDESGELVQEEE